MRPRHVILAGVVGATVACVAAQGDRSSPIGAGATTPTVVPVVAPVAPSDLHGPRIFDWTSSRVVGRSTGGIDPSRIRPLYTSGSGAGWNLATGAPVTADSAIYGVSWSTSTPSDLLFFGVDGSGAAVGITSGAQSTAPTKNFFALDNLYLGGGATTANDPAIVWSVSLAGGVDSAAALSADGSEVFVAGTDGTLHCLQTSGANQGTICSGWTDYSTSCATGVHGSSPWIDYGNPQLDVYIADTCGYVHRVHGGGGVAGTKQWAILAGATSTYQAPIRSGPIVLNGFVYVGDDMGQIFRITDGTSGTAPKTNSASVVAFATCSATGGSAPCSGYVAGNPDTPSAWAVVADLAFDTAANHAYAVANDYMFELNGGAGAWGQTAASPKQLGTGGVGPMYSAPGIDNTSGYVYTAFDNELVKVAYPFTGSSTSGVYLTHSSGLAHPLSSPLTFGSETYLGDSAGHAEAFDCTTVTGSDAIEGYTPVYGSSIGTDPIIDYQNGNLSFGYSTAAGGGGYAQFGLATSAFKCPSATPKLCGGVCASGAGSGCQACCVTTDCTGGAVCIGGTCVNTGCVNAAVCPSLPNTTASCGDAGACTYACLPGFANCNGTIETTGCPVNLGTDVDNCGACGTACSSNNLPVPVCASGVCAGQCADGYVDCDGNRQTNGCESTATCGSCCTVPCGTGTTCYDTGGIGTCVAGQTTMASGTASENGIATVTCPTGQKITALTFADYGTPGGVPSQSATAWNPLACGSNTTAATCGASPGCAWGAAGPCVATCSTQTTMTGCAGTTGCTWTTGAQPACIPTPCSGYTSAGSAACIAAPGCTWSGSCVAYACENLVGAACTLPGCSTNAATGTCTTTTCESLNVYASGLNTADSCDQTTGCRWNAATTKCDDSCASLTNTCGATTGCAWEGAVAGVGYVDACVTTGTCASLADVCDTQTFCTWTGGSGGSCSCAGIGEALCGSTPGCSWSFLNGCTGACTCDCLAYGDSTSCVANSGCSWSAVNGCTGTCSFTSGAATNACDQTAGCTWGGDLVGCNSTTCSGLADSCDTTSPCAWNGTACKNPAACGAKTNTCGTTTGCAFDTGASSCTASTGFLHDYGSASSTISPNTFKPECALDVYQNASFVSACLTGGPNSCSMTAKDDLFGTAANTPTGSTLPLPITAGPIANYPANPCPTLQKRLYIEAQCGTCP